MRWLWLICDKIYKNLNKALTIALFFFIAVIAVGFSAQFIGEKLAYTFLENKSVNYVVAFDETKPAFKQLYKKFSKDRILKKHHFRFTKTSKTIGLEIERGNFDVFITDDRAVVDTIIKNGFAGAYPTQTIPAISSKYVRLSRYGEYVKVRVNENVDIYIVVKNNLSTTDEAKVLKSLEIFGDNYFRRVSPDPYFEDEFDEELKKEKEELFKEMNPDKVNKTENSNTKITTNENKKKK